MYWNHTINTTTKENDTLQNGLKGKYLRGMKWIMPIYHFRNKETGEVFEDMMSISSKEELLKNNSHIEQVPTGFTIVGGVGDNMDAKTDDGFKEVMAKIAEKNPGSPLADRYAKNKTIKRAKTESIVREHKKKFGI